MKVNSINPKVVELTEAEHVLQEWHRTLLDAGYGVHESVEVMLNRTPTSSVTWRLLNQQDFRDWLTSGSGGDNPPDVCGATLTLGTTDPSSTECDLSPNHDPSTPHEGDDPLGVAELRVRWKGGGSCAGDRLPARDITYVRKRERR